MSYSDVDGSDVDGNGRELPEAIYCCHPSTNVHYYSEITDDGDLYEEYWCDRCNFWLTPGEMMNIHTRPDWNGGI